MAEQDILASPERPIAPFRTDTFRQSRPDIVGPDVPAPPFPIMLSGPVQKGFGRGGKDLRTPTGLSI
jgi:riboflavin kinase